MAVTPNDRTTLQYISTNHKASILAKNSRFVVIDIRYGVDHLLPCSHCSHDFYALFKNYRYSLFVCIYSVLELGQQVKDKKCNKPHLHFTVYKCF